MNIKRVETNLFLVRNKRTPIFDSNSMKKFLAILKDIKSCIRAQKTEI
jgi:hypothetical protein